MKNTKQEIVQWLVDNQATVRFIAISHTIDNVDPLFYEEAKSQMNDRIENLVIDEMSKSLGFTSEDYNSTISKEEFGKYLEMVML